MKKLFTLLLVAVMLLGIVGCGGEGEKTPETTQAQTNATVPLSSDQLMMGFAVTDITPKESTPLGGYGVSSKRWSNEVGYPMKATAMALTGTNGETILVITLDTITVREAWGSNLMLRLAEATGLDEQHIFVAASHTHCSPDLAATSFDAILRYQAQILDAISQAAVEALADRKVCEVSFGEVETEHMNHTRHYYNTNPDGSIAYFGDNYGHEISPDDTTRHMTDADPTLYVVKFTREGEKDMILCNFRTHPSHHGASSKYIASADFVGAYREAMQLQLDCDFMYMQGACGNINYHGKAPDDVNYRDVGDYGKRLTDYTLQALENMTSVEGTDLKTVTTTVEAKINHSMDHLFFEAKNISAVWNTNRDINEVIPMCRVYGMSSPFHANAIVSNYNKGESQTFPVSAYALGDNLVFGVWPFEVFDMLAVHVEENAPYDTVLTMGYAYPHQAYLPNETAWEYNSYESDTNPYVQGTGELVRDTVLGLMEQIKTAE